MIRVKYVKRGSIKPVYDIQTLTNTFTVHRVVVHNSMSAPHVTGLVTCMKQAHRRLLGRELTLRELLKICREYADHEKNNTSGWGLLTWRKYLDYLESEYGIVPR